MQRTMLTQGNSLILELGKSLAVFYLIFLTYQNTHKCLKWKASGRLVLVLHIQEIICLKNEAGSKEMNV